MYRMASRDSKFLFHDCLTVSFCNATLGKKEKVMEKWKSMKKSIIVKNVEC
jgi:hypothetical protein